MKQAGIRYKKADNCFTHLSDFGAAQALLKRFDPQRLHRSTRWPRAGWRCTGASGRACTGACIRRSGARTSSSRTPKCCRNSTARSCAPRPSKWACADLYRFMGKKPRANAKAQPSSRLQTLVQGTRLKHTLGATFLKMHDKAGCVLRLECTTSDVTTFQHRRKVEPRRSAGPGASRAGAGSSGAIKWARCASLSIASARWPR